MTSEMECWRCHETFNFDENDVRPFIYHECQDGKMTAHRRPENKRPHQRVYKKKTSTIWQEFK